MTKQVKNKDEDLENKNLEEGEMPAALKAYIDKKGKKGEKEKDDTEDDDKDDKEVKEKKYTKMKEDIDAIFSGEELSEEFKTNVKAIFEAAVTSRVSEIETDLQEQFDNKLNEQVNEIVSGIVDKVDEYLEYVVTEWVEENKIDIEKNLKAEVAEDFMVGLKNLFVENYIDIPEDKVNLIDEMAKKLQNAEIDLDKKITENADLISELNFYKKEQAIHTVAEGLSDIQIGKLKSLAENIEFINEQDYKNKLILTKRKYFESKENEKTTVSELKKDLDSADFNLEESFSPIMEHYVKNISKIVKK
jgi:hypothetical protein